MKKITLLLLIAFFAISCSNDDSNAAVVNYYTGSLVGEWKVISATNSSGTYDTSTEDCDDDIDYTRYSFIFNSDGSYRVVFRCNRENADSGTFTIDNHLLSMVNAGTSIYNVIDLGNNTIKMQSRSDIGTNYTLLKQ